MKTDKNFYFKGQYFENEDDFLKYANSWRELPINSEVFDDILNQMVKNVKLNIENNDIELTNGQLNHIIAEAFFYIMKKIMPYAKRVCIE